MLPSLFNGPCLVNGYTARRKLVVHRLLKRESENMRSILILIGIVTCFLTTVSGQTNLIVNGGFESATPSPWQFSGAAASVRNNSGLAHSGTDYLSLGGFGSQTVFASQTVTIPSNAVASVLGFYLNIVSSSHNSADTLTVGLADTNSTGTIIANLDFETGATPDPGQGTAFYSQRTFDLTSFVGRTVQVFFGADLSITGPSTFFNVDDVSLQVVTTGDLPANDYFTNHIAVTGVVAHVTANNAFATKEAGEPNHAGNPGGKSLWWTWTAPTNGVLQLNTSNSSFATLLAVYTGDSVGSLKRVASHDPSQDREPFAHVKIGVIAGLSYQIAVDGENGDSGIVNLNFSFAPDTTRPVVSITSPASGARTTNSTIVVQGTASDNVAVAQVEFRLENAAGTNDYQIANGTNRWTATVTDLIAGANTVRVRAFDTSSNLSLTVARTFTYVVVAPATVTIQGAGTVTPNYNGTLLELRKTYTITAKPAPGSLFSTWTGTVSSDLPKLTFRMENGLALQANFVPNPFTPVKGNYAGLFYDTNGVALASAGFFSATLADPGTFSAKLQFAGSSVSLAGKFRLDGSYSNSIPRRGQSALTVQLQLDLSGGDTITGLISDGTWVAELTANRAVFSRLSPAPEGGKKYTLAIAAFSDSAATPGGYGFAAVGVDASGNISLAGSLGDGTKISQRTFVSKSHQWPFFAPLYSGKGFVLGWLAFTSSDPNADLAGGVSWIKLAQPTAKLYPGGFALSGVETMGSLYSFVTGGSILNWTQGNIVLQGGNLTGSITNQVAIGPNNKVTGPNRLSLTFTTSSGLFKGSVLNPVSGKPIPVSGAILQKQNTGYGVFLGTTQSGSVILGP